MLVLTVLIKYRYVKSWLVTISRINGSIFLITINVIGIYLSIDQSKNEKGETAEVSIIMQYFGIGSWIFCIVLDGILLTLHFVLDLI